eukprot:5847799-Pyramimonas_sp.AAC.1
MEFWEVEEHEARDCWLKQLLRHPVRHPPRPPCGVICCSLWTPLETYQNKLLGNYNTSVAKRADWTAEPVVK